MTALLKNFADRLIPGGAWHVFCFTSADRFFARPGLFPESFPDDR